MPSKNPSFSPSTLPSSLPTTTPSLSRRSISNTNYNAQGKSVTQPDKYAKSNAVTCSNNISVFITVQITNSSA
eukprot:CAMPEP_0171292810 /NCGR_PEP_ID=MMETSP0816-20121228/746_1 /TAXON_ID=420281 /ORGANISM="Proboscia inermis, Strain CCAP1064/1" /LENGTH=72 /DNA_ID=CAMNT_0011762933 /DNA_START=17 /DNA_END=232 /DNA_ORIENTATION=-